MTTMKRTPRNPRRVVLADLKTARDNIAWLQQRWTAPGRIYDGEMGGRVREAHEYPENRPESWAELDKVTGDLIKMLADLQEYAVEQHNERKAV